LRLLLGTIPFSASMVLLLSWNMVVASGMTIPCAAMECRVHSSCPIASTYATSSASADIFVFNFCLHEVEYVVPFLSCINMPLWQHMSGCTVYKLSSQKFVSKFSSNDIIISLVPCRCCMPLVSFMVMLVRWLHSSA